MLIKINSAYDRHISLRRRYYAYFYVYILRSLERKSGFLCLYIQIIKYIQYYSVKASFCKFPIVLFFKSVRAETIRVRVVKFQIDPEGSTARWLPCMLSTHCMLLTASIFTTWQYAGYFCSLASCNEDNITIYFRVILLM